MINITTTSETNIICGIAETKLEDGEFCVSNKEIVADGWLLTLTAIVISIV